MKRILIIQAILPPFRVPFFESLHKALAEENVTLRVAYGRPVGVAGYGSSGNQCDLSFGARTRNYWFLGRRLLFQPVLGEIQRADLVVVEQANKHLVNYPLLLLSCLGIKKVAYWGHGWNRQRRKANSFSEKIKALLVRYPDWWFAYTRSIPSYLQSHGANPESISVVQNSVDVDSFRNTLAGISAVELARARSMLGIGPSAKVGLFCGRLSREKNLPFLLQAGKEIRNRLPDFHLVIIGDGPKRRVVEAGAARYDWVHFVGAKIGREKALLFRMASVFLSPGMITLAILDAFGSGLPVITTRIDTHSPEIDYLENGRNGLMSDSNLSDYARAVVDVISDQSLYERLSRGALASASNYSIDAMVQSFKNGLLQCLKQKRRRILR